MDTFYYYLIGALLIASLLEISALVGKVEGANMFTWFFFHIFAAIASIIYAIYIFITEDLSSAGFALLYSLGYVIIEGVISMLLLSFLADKVFKEKK